MANIPPLFDNSMSASFFISRKVQINIFAGGNFPGYPPGKTKNPQTLFFKKIHPMEYDLSGKWYVLYSNFPMWHKGNKKNPSFYYGTPTNGCFSDTVEYEQNDTIKKIEGTDTIQGTKFIWRGKGLLRFIKSSWEILYFNPKDGIAIIHFDKTLFTPEGYDVISREKTIHSTIEKELFSILYSLDMKGQLIKIQ